MSGPLESITGEMVTKALDVTWQNHKVIANNIANIDTAGYKPLNINFGEVFSQLGDLVDSKASDASLRTAINQINSNILPTVDELATKVMLDTEMVKLAENTTRYQALLNAKDLLGSINKIAITGGR